MPVVQQEEKALAAKKPCQTTGFYNAYLHGLLQQSG